jgi:hypothetical protein
MTRQGSFAVGHDARRNVSYGRPPSGSSIAATIRRTLGPDTGRICEQVRVLAAAGDPAAVSAAAMLLAAVATRERQDEPAERPPVPVA